MTLPRYVGPAHDDVDIAAECLRRTNDDRGPAGFRDCLDETAWSGAIGEGCGFDENGEVVGLTNIVAEVLPPAERTAENVGYRVPGPAPTN